MPYPIPPSDRAEARRFPTEYAGFTLRTLASLVDMMISVVVLMPLALLADELWHVSEARQALYVAMSGFLDADGATLDAALERLKQARPEIMASYAKQLPAMLLENAALVGLVLFCWFKYDATPGKLLFRMRIVDADTGAPPSRRQYVVRFFGYIPSVLCLTLGFVWIYFNGRRQGWHDMMAGTVVIRVKDKAYLKRERQEAAGAERARKGAAPSSETSGL
jgi:uncharacterized RDD family membrane protein YckC